MRFVRLHGAQRGKRLVAHEPFAVADNHFDENGRVVDFRYRAVPDIGVAVLPLGPQRVKNSHRLFPAG